MKKSSYTPKTDGQSAEDRALSTFAELMIEKIGTVANIRGLFL